MSNVRTVRFYDLCRICATSSDGKVDIFSSEGKMKNLWYKISECLSLTVEEKDRLPKVLCLQCVHHVETFMEFRNLCNVSQIKLNNWLNAATGESAAMKWLTQTPHNSNINEINTISNTLGQSPIQGQEPSMTLQISNYLNANVQASVVKPVTTPANQLQSNNDFLTSLIQSQQPPIIKSENLQDWNNGGNLVQSQQYIQETPILNTTHNINQNKTTDFKNNTLEEFLKMKPNLKVTPVRQKQQQNQNQKLKAQQERDHVQQQQQQQQQDQLQLQQLQQQLQQQQQQYQQQLQLQLLTSQLQPQQITITAPNTSLLPSINGQTLPTSAASLTQTQNGTNISLDNTNIMSAIGTSTAAGSATVNGMETVNETTPLKSKRPKLELILTPPQNPAQSITTSFTGQNITMPSQIQLQLQPTLQSAHAQMTATQQHQQPQQCNISTSTLFSNLVPYLQAPNQMQNQSLNAVLQNSTLASNQPPNSTNIFASSSKCYLPITVKDDATDQQYIAHIDARNFILPTTYQIQMKLQPQLATADGQPIMQLAPTSIPATLQLKPQALPATQTFQTITNMPPFNQNNANGNNNNILNGQLFQTALAQAPPPPPQHQQQQQQQRQTGGQIQTSLPLNEQILQNHAQDAITQSETVNKFNKRQEQQQQQQINLPENVQVTSQQIIRAGNNVKTAKDLTATCGTSVPDKSQLQPTTTTKCSVLAQKKYIISQTDDNTIEIIPSQSVCADASPTVTANNLKQPQIKQYLQKQKQQTQQQQQQTQQQQQQQQPQQHQQQKQQQQQQPQQRLQQSNANPVITQQYGSITLQRITTSKTGGATITNAYSAQPQIDSQKLQLPLSVSQVNKTKEQQQQQQQLSEQLQQQTQQTNSNIIKLPVLNKQNVTIRCVTKKSNKNVQQEQSTQQQQQQSLITATTAALPATATTTKTTKAIAMTVAASNGSHGISNQQQQQQQQTKAKRLLTLPTTNQKTATTTTATAIVNGQAATTGARMTTTTIKLQQSLPLLQVTHSSVPTPSTVNNENIPCNNNNNNNNNNNKNHNEEQEGGGIKSTGKMASTTKKTLLKKTRKSNANGAAQTANNNNSYNSNTNITTNNNNNNNKNTQVRGNVEKPIELSMGATTTTTTTLPPGKYIIKDLNTAKAIIAATTAAANSTAGAATSNIHNKQQARQCNPSNVTITKAVTKRKRTTTPASAAIAADTTTTTTPAATLTTSPADNNSATTMTQITIKSHNNNVIANATTATAATAEAATTAPRASTAPTDTTAAATRYPLECATCFKTFKKREHLTQHVKLHAGIRPFKCSEDDCNKAFSRKEHLLRHLVSHTGKKLFICDICEKPFSRKDNLSKHRRTHTDPASPVKYICEVCNRTFVAKAYFQQHKKQHQTKETNDEEEEKSKKLTCQKNLKAAPETIPETATTTATVTRAVKAAGGSEGGVTSKVKLKKRTTQQLLQQQKEIHPQIQLIPQQTVQQQHQLQQQQQQQQHTITAPPTTTQIMHLQFPTSLISSQDLNGCNTITITRANNHDANITNNNHNVTLKALTNNSIHHNLGANVLTLPTSLADFVQQAQFVNTTTGQILGQLKIDK